MAEKKVFTITDLGGGDGGKGGVVHAVCVRKKAHTVIKVGGAQGSHGVRTSRGESFNFSHFGCGTFEGVKTFISNRMVIEPYALLEEAERLKQQWRIGDIFSYLTVDAEALCVTPYHAITSKLRELGRKDHPKGTVGVGVGEAARDAEFFPELAIYAKDLGKPYIRERLEMVRMQKMADIAEIVENPLLLLSEDQHVAQQLIALLYDDEFISRIIIHFDAVARNVTIVDQAYLAKHILGRDGVFVVESSHGILTDRYYGFHPHTSYLRTLPKGTRDLLRECNYDGDVKRLGVTRAYQIRHGAGPMVTESPAMVEQLLPGSSKDENRWQGKVRVGPLDFVALKYAIEVCGGALAFDGLAITWFDQIQKLGMWSVCHEYENMTNRTFFSSEKEMIVRYGNDMAQLKHQAKLCKLLEKSKPHITSYDIHSMSKANTIALCQEVCETALNVSVKMISFGSTEKDKVFL